MDSLYRKQFESIYRAVRESVRVLPCTATEAVEGLHLIAFELEKYADEIEHQVRQQAGRPMPSVLPKGESSG